MASYSPPVQQDLRFIFDTLYSNRHLSTIRTYFSVSDIQTLLGGYVFQSGLPLETLLALGSSKGLYVRFPVVGLSTNENPVYVYSYNRGVLTANPTNINLFRGTCPPIPTCLLNFAGNHNTPVANFPASERDRQRAGTAYSTKFSPFNPPSDSRGSCFGELNESSMCSVRFHPLDAKTPTCQFSCVDGGPATSADSICAASKTRLIFKRIVIPQPIMANPCRDEPETLPQEFPNKNTCQTCDN